MTDLERCAADPPVVIAFGGGLDGTAMLFEMRDRGLRPDRIQFADCGNRDAGESEYAEKPETYEHVDRMSALTEKWWGLPIVWVRNDGMYKTLERNCLEKAMLPSAVYGFSSCSEKYKHRPMAKDLKAWQPAIDAWAAGLKITKLIGYNASESHRSFDTTENKDYVYRYPLIEWQITRGMVREICLRELGFLPLKSACFFCPSSKPHEVAWLKREHPRLFARAIAMEKTAAPNLNNIDGLGRHWSWESAGRMHEGQLSLLSEPPRMPCMCFDGESE